MANNRIPTDEKKRLAHLILGFLKEKSFYLSIQAFEFEAKYLLSPFKEEYPFVDETLQKIFKEYCVFRVQSVTTLRRPTDENKIIAQLILDFLKEDLEECIKVFQINAHIMLLHAKENYIFSGKTLLKIVEEYIVFRAAEACVDLRQPSGSRIEVAHGKAKSATREFQLFKPRTEINWLLPLGAKKILPPVRAVASKTQKDELTKNTIKFQGTAKQEGKENSSDESNVAKIPRLSTYESKGKISKVELLATGISASADGSAVYSPSKSSSAAGSTFSLLEKNSDEQSTNGGFIFGQNLHERALNYGKPLEQPSFPVDSHNLTFEEAALKKEEMEKMEQQNQEGEGVTAFERDIGQSGKTSGFFDG